MRAYFTASLRGKIDCLDDYKAIVKILEGAGLKVVADHILTPGIEDKVKMQTPDERHEAYKKLSDRLKSADLVVAEISTPSISVGHEVSYALELTKPVIVLHTHGKGSSMLEGASNEKLQVIEYQAGGDLEKKFLRAIEEAKKNVDVRFNFFVSPKILNYLDFVAKHRMIPRSVFLRDLIEREMKRDKEFKE